MRSTAKRGRLPTLACASALAMLSALVCTPAIAAVDGFAPRGPLQSRPGGQVSLDQAIERAERQFRARVVRAGVDESNGERAYVLRLVSEQGRVWTVRVDARTGAMN